METIVRENDPEDLGDLVVKACELSLTVVRAAKRRSIKIKREFDLF